MCTSEHHIIPCVYVRTQYDTGRNILIYPHVCMPEHHMILREIFSFIPSVYVEKNIILIETFSFIDSFSNEELLPGPRHIKAALFLNFQLTTIVHMHNQCTLVLWNIFAIVQQGLMLNPLPN